MEVTIPSIHLTPAQVQSLSLRDGSILLPLTDQKGQRIGIHLPSSQVQSLKLEDGSVRTRRTRMSVPNPPDDSNTALCDRELSCGSLINQRRTLCGRWPRGNFTGWKNENQCKIDGEIDVNECPEGYVTICALLRANQCAPGYKCIGTISKTGGGAQDCLGTTSCILEHRNVCERDWDQVLQEDDGTRGVQCAIGLIEGEVDCPPELCSDSKESASYMASYCSTLDNYFKGYVDGQSFCEVGIFDRWSAFPAELQQRKEMLQKVVSSFFQRYPPGTDYSEDPTLAEQYQKIKRLLFSEEFKGYFDDTLYRACSTFTEEDMAEGGELSILCGCHLPSYTFFPGVVNVECQPVCRIEGVVGIGNGAGGWKTCNQSNCVIDNISIQAKDNSSIGPITFNQLCGGPEGSGSATCTFSNIDIQVDQGTLDHLDFTQDCGKCQAYDPKTKKVTPIPGCKVTDYYKGQIDLENNTNAGGENVIQQEEEKVGNFYKDHKIAFWVIIISIIVIILLVVIVFVFFIFK
jgi:hypothetical protein